MKIIIKRTGIIIAVVILITAVFTVMYYLMWQQGMFLPSWINWHERNIETNVNDKDYNITLSKNKSVTVSLENSSQEENIIWTTDSGIKVQDVLTSDIDDMEKQCPFGWRKMKKIGHNIYLYMNIVTRKSPPNGCLHT
jgi:hypothetical protein